MRASFHSLNDDIWSRTEVEHRDNLPPKFIKSIALTILNPRWTSQRVQNSESIPLQLCRRQNVKKENRVYHAEFCMSASWGPRHSSWWEEENLEEAHRSDGEPSTLGRNTLWKMAEYERKGRQVEHGRQHVLTRKGASSHRSQVILSFKFAFICKN